MEPSKQGVPSDPSSLQEQPQPYPPPTTQPLLSLAVGQPQPTQHVVQRSQEQQPSVDWASAYYSLVEPQFYGHIPSSINATDYAAVTPRFDGDGVPGSSLGKSSSTPSFGATQGQTSATGPHVGATDHFSLWSDNAILNPFAFPSAILSAGQVDPGSRSPEPAISRQLTLEEEQALGYVRHLVPGRVDVAGASARVVRLLKEDSQEIRRTAIGAVMASLRVVMGSSEWRCVFDELLRPGRHDELEAIVHAACKFSLVRLAENGSGLTSVKDLFNAVKLHPQLRQHLINCLVNEGEYLFRHMRGPDLLRSIFTTFPYDDSSIVIQCAIDNFGGVLSFVIGRESMMECFVAAKNGDLHRFEEIICLRSVEIAKGKHSNRFLQEVLEHCSDKLKDNITDVVVDHLVSLSSHQYGNHVVQACFLRTGSRRLPLLQSVLTKFQGLTEEELARLVQDPFATYVVCQLLKAGMNVFRDETMLLARRIQSLPVAGLQEEDQPVPMRKVMAVIWEVLS